MTSRLWRLEITVAFLGFASILPATVGAQSYAYLPPRLQASTANASTIIYSTFGPGDTYDMYSGWTIGGTLGYFQGLQFTPAESGVVETIEIAAFRLAGGTNLNVSLTTDAGDRPGSVLETVPICCFGDEASIQLANSVLRPLLTGGTKYWLVVSPVAAGDLFGWNRNRDLPPALNVQQYSGGPLIAGLDWQGTMRIRSDESTSTIAMTFDITPNTFNLGSQGPWITGFLEPPSPFAASDIDISSIRLNDTVPVDPAAPSAIGDHDGNGVPDLMVKFNRTAVELTVPNGDNVSVTVTGTVAGHDFTGSDDIRVIRAVVSAPLAGSHLSAGSVTHVRWQTPSGVTVESVTLLQSFDNGSTWSLITHAQPNTGSYDWTVPSVQTDQAKVAVVLVESADATGTIVDGVLGVSESFSIDALVGVGDGGPVQFALHGVAPNPAKQELRVNFSLRDSKPATLALFDVSGRQVETRRVDGMGPGWHTVALGGRSNLPAGLYVIRLTQEGRSLTTRAAVVR